MTAAEEEAKRRFNSHTKTSDLFTAEADAIEAHPARTDNPFGNRLIRHLRESAEIHRKLANGEDPFPHPESPA